MSTSEDAKYSLLTLKPAVNKLHALASVPEPTLRSLFLSMTKEQKVEVIGQLATLNNNVGNLYVQCLRINQLPRSFKMDYTTLRSFCVPMEYAQAMQGKTPCSSTTRSNRKT